MEEHRNISLVLDTLQDCLRRNSETPGEDPIAMLVLGKIPMEDSCHQVAMVSGVPISLLLMLQERMHQQPLIRNLIFTAAAAFKLYERMFPDKDNKDED